MISFLDNCDLPSYFLEAETYATSISNKSEIRENWQCVQFSVYSSSNMSAFHSHLAHNTMWYIIDCVLLKGRWGSGFTHAIKWFLINDDDALSFLGPFVHNFLLWR